MIGEAHAFGARGDDQMRFERAAEDYFAALEVAGIGREGRQRFFRPFQIRRAWWGDVGGFVAESFLIDPPTKAA